MLLPCCLLLASLLNVDTVRTLLGPCGCEPSMWTNRSSGLLLDTCRSIYFSTDFRLASLLDLYHPHGTDTSRLSYVASLPIDLDLATGR